MVDDHFLRVAAAREQRHHSIAALPSASFGANLRDHAGAFEAEDFRRARWRWVVAGGLEEVGAIYSGGAYGDAQVSRSKHSRMLSFPAS
jgi:hypothetical protein